MSTQLELEHAWIDEPAPCPGLDGVQSGVRVVSWDPYTLEHADGTREVRAFPGERDDGGERREDG